MTVAWIFLFFCSSLFSTRNLLISFLGRKRKIITQVAQENERKSTVFGSFWCWPHLDFYVIHTRMSLFRRCCCCNFEAPCHFFFRKFSTKVYFFRNFNWFLQCPLSLTSSNMSSSKSHYFIFVGLWGLICAVFSSV